MPDMLIRNVSERTQTVLKRRAKDAGMSVQAYVLRLLDEHAGRPTMKEWLDRVQPHRTFDHSVGAQAVRGGREDMGWE